MYCQHTDRGPGALGLNILDRNTEPEGPGGSSSPEIMKSKDLRIIKHDGNLFKVFSGHRICKGVCPCLVVL